MKKSKFFAVLSFAAAMLLGDQSAFAQALTPGNAISFDGSGQYANVTHNPTLNAYPLTVSAWLKTTQNSATSTGVINKYVAGSLNGWNIFLRNGHVRAFYFGDAANYIWDGGDGLDGGFVADGNWHHIAFIVDSSSGKLLVDGNAIALRPWTGTPTTSTTTTNLNIARYPGGAGGGADGFYSGLMDEVQIWVTSLTQAQIRANMNRSLVGNESGLRAYYRFDEASGFANNDATSGFVADAVPIGSQRVTSTVPFVPGPITSPVSQLALAGTARLNASVNANNTNGQVWFEWGATTGYGNRTPLQALAASQSFVAFSAMISNLLVNQTYHFRIGASNVFGVNVGGDQAFSIKPTNTVTTLADGVAGSLRQILADAPADSRIEFSVTGQITLTNELVLNKNITIAGPGADVLALNGNGGSRIFKIEGGTVANLSGLTLTNGQASLLEGGGAIHNSGTLSLDACRLMGNRAGNGSSAFGFGLSGGSGGAILNQGTLTVLNCTLGMNRSGEGVGSAAGTPKGGDGGGLFNSGMATIQNSTLSDNACGNGVGTFTCREGGSGGGIANGGSLTLTSCTVSGNQVGYGSSGFSCTVQDGVGGNIRNFGSATLAIVASTIASAPLGGGLRNDGGAGNATLRNVIVAGNTSFDVNGLFTSLGHNLIGQSDGANGFTNGVQADLVGAIATPVDPLLSPLADLDGSTMTHGLLNGSPAINAGDDAVLLAPANLATDQRGHPRQFGAHVDIGAFERGADPMVTTLGAALSAPLNLINGFADISLAMSAIPGDAPAAVWFQFGLAPSYGGNSASTTMPPGTNPLPFNATNVFGPGAVIHYRAVASNLLATIFGQDQTFVVPLLHPLGDANGDGIVDQGELNLVLTNYWPNSPWLVMTNPVVLGQGNFQFALTNANAWNFTVLVSTNLVEWSELTTALPVYQFFDPAANTNAPERYYRLRWP